ncbi:response regulator [Corynebacterium urogenitale]
MGIRAVVKVLLADDQTLVRGAMAALLSTESDIEVVAETGTGDNVVQLAREHQADVALLDIEMPGLSGIEAAGELKRSGVNCRSIIVTTFGRPGYLKKALAAGASGFVVKDTPPEQLAEAVRRVHAGHRVVDPTLAEQSLFTPESPLTQREVDVARVAVTGATIREIAQQLHLSSGTVRNHVSAIIAKTNTGTRFEAARKAQDYGWL